VGCRKAELAKQQCAAVGDAERTNQSIRSLAGATDRIGSVVGLMSQEPCDLAKHLRGVAAVALGIATILDVNAGTPTHLLRSAAGVLVAIRFQRPGCRVAQHSIGAPGFDRVNSL